MHASRFGIDADRIALWGESAGGYLACMAAVTGDDLQYSGALYPEESNKIAAVVECFGVTDAARIVPEFTQDNPLPYLTPDAPPFLIMHGKKDQIVPYVESVNLYETLQKKGIPASLYLIDNAEHGGVVWQQPAVVQQIITYLSDRLK